MEWFDLIYKLTSFIIIPIIWWLKVINDKLSMMPPDTSGKIQNVNDNIKLTNNRLDKLTETVVDKFDRLEEHQHRDHTGIEKKMSKLEDQHCGHDASLAVLMDRTGKLTGCLCKEDK